MNNNRKILFMILAIWVTMLSACVRDGGSVTTSEEESGTQLALDETYDVVRNGA